MIYQPDSLHFAYLPVWGSSRGSTTGGSWGNLLVSVPELRLQKPSALIQSNKLQLFTSTIWNKMSVHADQG